MARDKRFAAAPYVRAAGTEMHPQIAAVERTAKDVARGILSGEQHQVGVYKLVRVMKVRSSQGAPTTR